MSHRKSPPLESFGTELAVAVDLTDRYTDREPRGSPNVTLANAPYEFLQTPSGYYALVDAPAEPTAFEVVVEAEYYLDERRSIDRSSLDPDAPLASIDLLPGPAYPFGGGATLVRGMVTEDDDPVADATVAYVQGSDGTRTNEDGEFALPIEDVTREDVTIAGDDGPSDGGPGNGGPGGPGGGGGGGPGSGGPGDSGSDDGGPGDSGPADADSAEIAGQRILRPGGDPPRIEATHPTDERTTDETVTVRLGRTARVDLSF